MTKADTIALIHIGYHKTATTFLQKKVFVPALGFDPLDAACTIATFIDCNPWERDPVLLPAPVGVRVVTHERLSGHPLAGGVDSPLIRDRLARALPNARVLVVVREQVSAILSNYAQYVRGGGGASLAHVLRGLPGLSARAAVPWFRLDFFAYDRLVAEYQTTFGAAAVLVLPYEQLVADPAGFVHRVLEFADVRATCDLSPIVATDRVNQSLSGRTLLAKRIINRAFVVNRYSPGPLLPSKRAQYAVLSTALRIERALAPPRNDKTVTRWRRVIAETVGDRYAQSNRRLGELTGIDLAPFGYRVSEH